MTRYDFTAAQEWLNHYPAKDMSDQLKDNALGFVNFGLELHEDTDPKEKVLRLMEAVNFVCGFLDTIKEVKGGAR